MDRFHTTLTFLILALCTHTSAQAQVRKAPSPTRSEAQVVCELPANPYKTGEVSQDRGCVLFVEHMPEFSGGSGAMYKFIKANLRIPSQAKMARVSGKVFVRFVIEKTGEVTNPTVLKGIGFGCDSEAVRLVKSMPKWKPGKQDGQPVMVSFVLPIFFESKK